MKEVTLHSLTLNAKAVEEVELSRRIASPLAAELTLHACCEPTELKLESIKLDSYYSDNLINMFNELHGGLHDACWTEQGPLSPSPLNACGIRNKL